MSASHQPCRDLLAEVMRDVRERVPADHVAHGPGGLYIPAVACCLWASKAEGWQGYLAARAPERLPTRPRGGAREGAGRSRRRGMAKLGRPLSADGPREMIAVRLSVAQLATLDAWQEAEGLPTRSAAIRHLIHRANKLMERRAKEQG